ncbi:MAG: LicD family protein [Oscillospiraceae bacterium]|nr:LicD family protein [Oscillospiraceae bacterium]
MDSKKTRKLQFVVLDIFKEFLRICNTYNLKYYAFYGTVLGAVRHKGFIPWDDDIDVVMPREDYDKFYNIAVNELTCPYIISTINNDDETIQPIIVIKNINVKTINNTTKEKIDSYACLDIHPLNGLPDSAIKRFFIVRKFLLKKMFFSISVFNKRVDQYKRRPWYGRLIIMFCNRFDISRFFNKKKVAISADNLLKSYCYGKTKKCSELWGVYRTKSVYLTQWIGDGITLPFEDVQIIVPSDYNSYLKHLYGNNYMELPPEKERFTHATDVIFCNESQ